MKNTPMTLSKPEDRCPYLLFAWGDGEEIKYCILQRLQEANITLKTFELIPIVHVKYESISHKVQLVTRHDNCSASIIIVSN